MISDALKAAYRFHRKISRSASAASALEQARRDVERRSRRYTSTPQALPLPGSLEAAERASWPQVQTRYIESAEVGGMRFVGYADEVSRRHGGRIDHKGWYTAVDEQRTFRGAVLQLPGRRSAMRFVAAYQSSDEAGFVIDLSPGAVFVADDSYSSPIDSSASSAARDAAIVADGFAEREAQEAREYDEAWQAGSEFHDIGQNVRWWRREALAILRERRQVASVKAPALCSAIRAQVDSLLSDIRAGRERREELKRDVAVSLRYAFEEGAGGQVAWA